MARSNTTTILGAVLAIAVIIGLAAVAYSLFFSGEGDSTDTPNDTPTSQNIDRCNQITIYDLADNSIIEAGTDINPSTDIAIEAEFENNSGQDQVYEEFIITINSSENQFKIDAAEALPELSGESRIYKPRIEFEDLEDLTSISVTAEAIDTDSLSESNPTCNEIRDVSQDADAIDSGQTDDGDSTDGDTTGDDGDQDTTDEGKDECIALGQSGTSSDQCCQGLTRVSCQTPDEQDQCINEDDCITCVTSTKDNICGSGENVCNSPEDCDEDGDTETPITPKNATITIQNAGPQCVTRLSPENTARFNITVSNSSDETAEFTEVSASIPLGFSYQANSSIINGTADSTDQYTAVTTVGDSQEITWSAPTNWTLSANNAFVISFVTTAGPQALTGTNTFSAAVTPVNPQDNLDALRTDYQFEVSQTCSTPKTSLFESTIARLAAGVALIIIAGLFYISQVPVLSTRLNKLDKTPEDSRAKFEKKFTKK